MVYYPNLSGEIAKRGIKKRDIANTLGICEKSFRNKMNGVVPFTWPEVKIMRREFFPDMNPDVLFRSREDTPAR